MIKNVLRTFIVFAYLAVFIRPVCAQDIRAIVDVSDVRQDINALVLGNNVQWVDSCDGLYDCGLWEFHAERLKLLKKLSIGSLRFPGGTLADAYHWEDAIGDPDGRREGFHNMAKKKQPSCFGTDEFIALCDEFGAEPVITVNMESGSYREAAGWVRYCNSGSGKRVSYWEIGNEPYLFPEKGKRPSDFPEEFAGKAIRTIREMKAVDGDIKCGVPLRTASLTRIPAMPFLNWNDRVLSLCKDEIDFVSVHNTYFPAIFKEKDYSYPEAMESLMTSVATVKESIEETKGLLLKYGLSPERKIAVTEYNAFMSFPGVNGEEYTASSGAGIYVASLLAYFLQEESILMANFWSLCGNWYFGTVTQTFKKRPQYYVLKIFSDFLGDKVLNSEIVNNGRISSAGRGFAHGINSAPALDILATGKGDTVFVILVNRSLNERYSITVDMRDVAGIEVEEAVVLHAKDPRDTNEYGEKVLPRNLGTESSGTECRLILPECSLAAVKFVVERV